MKLELGLPSCPNRELTKNLRGIQSEVRDGEVRVLAISFEPLHLVLS